MNKHKEKHEKYLTPGYPDDLFIRSPEATGEEEKNNIPLTKTEIRALSLSKLKLEEGHKVLDVGAGSGGLTVECARLMSEGWVWAVERDPEALKVIGANLEKFGLTNVTVLAGEAGKVLCGSAIPQQFDRIIIGGSGGELALIVERAGDLLAPGGIIVINCLLLENLVEAQKILAEKGFCEISYIQAAISRSRQMGAKTALNPLNPVFIISAVNKGG